MLYDIINVQTLKERTNLKDRTVRSCFCIINLEKQIEVYGGIILKKKLIILLCVVLALALLFVIFYNTPKTFGKGIDISEVNHIKVFDGTTGVGFTIDEPDDIQYIVDNIQSHSMKRDGISSGYTGYRFRINYMNKEDNNIVSEFIVNSGDTIRKDPFFYRCDGRLCIDYLESMEEKYKSN